MKKIIIILLVVSTVCFNNVLANDYQTYQEITFKRVGAKLLRNYKEKHYEAYYKKLKKPRFWGWKVMIATKDEEIRFTSNTYYSIYNNGKTPIVQKYYIKTEETSKFQISATGSVETSVKGTVKKFKSGLDAKIKSSVSTSNTKTVTEKYEIRIEVDPGTKLLIRTKGEGRISNGVAKYYRFWKNVKKGGWETFVMTTEYYDLVKEEI